jgi:hypothetical protein
MDNAPDIVMPENRQRGRGVADQIIGLSQGLQTHKILRGGGTRLGTHVGNVAHATQSHVGAPSHQAGDNGAVVRCLLGIASQHMRKCLHEGAVPIDEMQHAPDVLLLESVEKGMVHRLAALGILQGPANLCATVDGLEVLIVT